MRELNLTHFSITFSSYLYYTPKSKTDYEYRLAVINAGLFAVEVLGLV